LSIREGYGLTETSPVIAFNRYEPGGVNFGTVGIPIPGIEVRIDQPNEEGVGEVQVKGPNVMLGYFINEAATKAMWTEDGWFRSGDLGQWEHKRFLQLYGRRDDLFKTGAGKFIVPEVVEREYRLSPYIAQIVVTGANQAHLAALIVPDFGVLEHWCLEHNVHWTAPQFMVINPKVVQFFKTVIDQVNLELPPYQQVKHFALLHDPWTEESGELTPTLKLRRKKILQKNEQLIHELYN
jgi:long-chain acyl-CoA synthetase